MNFLFLLLFFPQFSLAKETFTLERAIRVKTCLNGGTCTEFLPQENEIPTIRIALEKSFAKGINGGVDGWDRHKISAENITFKSEIHLIQYTNKSIYLYAMLRSGSGTKRNGNVHKVSLESASALKPILIQDEPIPFNRGTVQAQLVIRPLKIKQ